MERLLKPAQRDLLERIAANEIEPDPPNGLRVSARAMAARGLVRIRGRGPLWSVEVTSVGNHYLQYGDYPPSHRYAKSPEAIPMEVDSPAGMRERGRKPRGDDLLGGDSDPYDGRVLISVKEAAWMLSLPESAIYAAVRDGDLDRVFIGSGATNYRVVYGSLLAWVNDLPRESARRSWLY